jgi:beta-lactamase class C
MIRLNTIAAATMALILPALLPANTYAAEPAEDAFEAAVAHAVVPVMQQYAIPGMAVALVVNGREHLYYYGKASNARGTPVARDTLFEIGSISKTFTATLAAYAQLSGKMSLTQMASTYLPILRGSAFDHVSLLNLGTHTSGGLPLQVPDEVTNNAQLMAYFRTWTPIYPAGTYRTYANPSIGLLGVIAAKSLNRDFAGLMEGELYPQLGLKNTFLDVPKARMESYAQGYTSAGAPIRMTPGVLAAETYGVRTTAADLLRFVEANMHMLELKDRWQRAIDDTHTGYYRIGPMTQDLIWEQYAYPVTLQDLLAGNSSKVMLEANLAIKIKPPLRPKDDVLINKTGSTNGFSAYVTFVPALKTGIVILANKSYPIDARVTTAYDILSDVIDKTSSH